MEAAMSTTPGRGLRGQQLEDSAYIDISRETPINNRPQAPPQQIPQPNQYYSPQVPQGQQFYQQSNMSYDAAYGYPQQFSQQVPHQIPQQIPQQPVAHPRQSVNTMHPRRSSITSTTSSSMNKFFKGKMRRGGGGGGGDDGDEDEGETEAQPGVDVSFDDIKHLRDRGRYGMSNAPFDTTPYIPTLSTKGPGPNGQISNTQYRKLKMAQMKTAMKSAPVAPRANSLQTPGPYGAPPMDNRTMSLNTRPGGMMDNRTMSLNSRPIMYPPQQQAYPPQQMGYQQSPRTMSFQGPGPRFGTPPIQGSPVLRGSPGFVPPTHQQLPPHQRKGSWSNLPQRGPVMSPNPHQYDPYYNQRQMPPQQQPQKISPQRSMPQMRQQRSQENLSGGPSRNSLKTDSSKEVSPLRNVYSENESEPAEKTKVKKKLNKYSFNMEEDIDEELERLEKAKTREMEEQATKTADILQDQQAQHAQQLQQDPLGPQEQHVPEVASEAPQETHYRSSSTVPSSIISHSRSHTQNRSASSSMQSTPNKKPSADSLRKHALAANVAPSPQRSFGRRDSLVSDLTDLESPTRGVKQPLYQLSTGTANEVYVTAPELQDVVDEEEEPEDEVTGLGVISSTVVSQVIEKEPIAPVHVDKAGSQRSIDSTKTLEGNQDSAVSDTDHGSQSFPSGNDTTMEDLSCANDSTMMEEVKASVQRMDPEQSYTDGSSVIYRPDGLNIEVATPHSERTIELEGARPEAAVPPPPVVQSQVYKSMLFSDDVAPPVPLQARERKASFPPPTSAVMANTTEKLGNPAARNFQNSSESFESPKVLQTANRKNSAISLKENSPIMKSVNFFKKVSKKAKDRGYKEDSATSTPKFGNDFESSPRFNVITTASAGMEGTYSHNYQSYAKHESEMRKGDRSVFLPDVESAPSQKSQSSFDKALPEVPPDNNDFDFGSPKKNSSRTRRPRRSVDTKSIDILNYKLDVDLPAERLSLFSRNSALLPSDMNFNVSPYNTKQLPEISEKHNVLPHNGPSASAPAPARSVTTTPAPSSSFASASATSPAAVATPVPAPVEKESKNQPVVATKEVHNNETARSTPVDSTSSSRYVSTQASDVQSRAVSSESHLRSISADQLGLLHANQALLDELQSVSNALAESITREYNLEEKLKSGKSDTEVRSVDEDSLREKSTQIANLSKQLVEERRMRHLAEELCLKWENGLKPSPVELSYQNAELTSKLREQEEKLDQCQQKVESLEAEKPELLRKIQKLTVENKELTTVTIPHLKNSVQVLETGSSVGNSAVDATELAKENEYLKSQMDLHARVSNDVTMVEQQRDALRDAIKSMREKHEIEMRLANEKIRNLETRVAKFSDISRRKGSGNSEVSSPSLRMHTSFQNMRSPSLGTPPPSQQDTELKSKHTASSSSSSSTKSTPGLNVPVTISNTEI